MAIYKPNSGQHVDDIISRTTCLRHKAPEGTPCFYLRSDKGLNSTGVALCGERIKVAGFNGKIDPKSLSQGSKGPRPRR